MRAREFTEPRGAGCIIRAADTGRWCLQQRSESVSDPGIWSTWGGGREPGETLEQTVRRELAEESGYTGPLKLEPLMMSQSYATYIGHVPHEFEPQLNSESQDSRWVEAGDWPGPLHPGLARALDKISNGVTEAQSAKTGIYQTDVLGAKAYHAKCMEPNCDWESKRFDRIKQAQAAAEKHAKSHFKQGVAEGLEQSLAAMVGQDQSERNEYSQFVKSQAGGDWSKGAKMYAQLKKRPIDDIFGDAIRLNQFMKMKFDFDKFTNEDWDNYWLLAQHCDDNRDFQKNALSIIKKYQGTDHSHYKYLYDRISMGLTGKQKYGTQNVKEQGVVEGSDFFAGSKFADEEGNTFSVEKIIAFAKKNPKYFHKDFPLSKIKHDLSWWQGNKERMMNADTSFPLLVIQNDDGHLGVADGLNRMKKAVDVEKKQTIDVYLVPKKDIMKFSEKQGVAEGLLAEETLDDYLASLKNRGAKIIGRGNNAMVFTNPEDDRTVIKVMHQPDPAYLAYLRQSIKHPNNPWLPRVLDVTSQAFDTANPRSSTTAWIIVLEKLRPASAAEVKNAVDTVLATVNPRYLGAKPIDAYRTFDDIKKLWPTIAQHSSDADIRVFAEFLSQFSPQDIDVSRSNVMMRGSQLVFADPVLS